MKKSPWRRGFGFGLLLVLGCGAEPVGLQPVASFSRAPLSRPLPGMLDGTWSIVVDWPLDAAQVHPGDPARIRFAFLARRWVAGWTDQEVIDATQLCAVEFPRPAGSTDRPALARSPTAYSGVELAGGTVFYDTRRPVEAEKSFHYEPPVVALGLSPENAETPDGAVTHPPRPLWQLEARDYRVDSDGDGQPGVTLLLPGGTRQSISMQAHFRLESTLTGSGVETLRAGVNTWPPTAVIVLSNQPINLPYLGPPKQTYYGAQSYNVPGAGDPVGQMVRVEPSTTCSEIATYGGNAAMERRP